MSEKKQKLPQRQSITIPRNYANVLEKIQKATASLSICTDYLRDATKEITRLGAQVHQTQMREQENLAKISKKLENKAKKEEKSRRKKKG